MRIKMPSGMKVGIGSGNIVLDGDVQLPHPPLKGAQQPVPLFGSCLLWPNGLPSQQQQLLSSFDHATYRSRQKRGKTLPHFRQDSLALRSELFLGHVGTSTDLSGQFRPTKLVPKCSRSIVYWV